MLKVYTDFNNMTDDDVCWLLRYQDAPVQGGLFCKGDRVVLFQDGDEFEVEATVDFRFVQLLGRDCWVAIPDWSTLKHKD